MQIFSDWLSAASQQTAHWLSRLTQLQAAVMPAYHKLTMDLFQTSGSCNILTTAEVLPRRVQPVSQYVATPMVKSHANQ
ncbi:hypothetical protein E2C01_032750 [Portunus trituberculatus]|uniref:Uncharacterized protein n=1 Tax=Portunus trituberculatus TaxID=210409 RepID=A0A5B7EYA0_PORTR|nr:hypothetical protein [Portunus trituberculatus]